MLNIRKLTVFSFLLTTTSSSLMGMPENSEPGPSSTPPSQTMKKSQQEDLRSVSQEGKQPANKKMVGFIRKKQAQKKRENEQLENEEQKGRELIQTQNARRSQRSQSSIIAAMPITFGQPKEEKFQVAEAKVKVKTKGKLDLEKAQMKENLKKTNNVSKSLETSEIEKKADPLKSSRAPKKAIFSEKGEELSGGAKKILSRLFSPYDAEITWDQLKVSQKNIKTLLSSAGFVLEEPTGGSHFKVKKKDEPNHLLSLPIHGPIKAIYLKNLSEVLASEGIYPLAYKENLEGFLDLESVGEPQESESSQIFSE